MNMHARFALGMLAGLLVGVAIVGSSYVYPSSSFAGAIELNRAPAGATVTQSTTYQTFTAVTSTTAGGYPSQVTNTSSTVTNGGSKNVTTAWTTTAVFDVAVQGQPALASQVSSITHGPAVQSFLVLIPIVAAVLFGLVLYKVSAPEREEKPVTS